MSPSRQWLSPVEFAREYNRAPRTVRRWCTDGTLPAFGIRVICTGKWKKYWIEIPYNGHSSLTLLP